MTKINRIISNWIPDTISSTSYLNGLGLTYDHLQRYKKSGWIESVGYGAYKRKHDKIEWSGAMYCLQDQLKLSVHPGGKTALELLGLSHYVPFHPIIKLYSFDHKKLPTWFRNFSQDKKIAHYGHQLFPVNQMEYLQKYQFNNFSILISSPELAAFELLYHIPKNQTFDEAKKIFENLTTLRSQLVQELLNSCSSIKVKRIFLFLAEQNNYHWFQKLDTDSVDLGSGKRVIVKNGVLNKKYLITVPEDVEDDREPIL